MPLREALQFTFRKIGAGTEARREGTGLRFTSCMVGMPVSPYGELVDEMQRAGNFYERQT